MSEKQISPILKQGLELGPIILFFVAYLFFKDDTFTIGGTEYDGFILVTALFVPLILASTGILWWLTGSLNKMQVMTAVLVTFFGGLTVWLNDDRFIKMKPTLIYLIFGGALGVGLLQGQSYLRYLMGEMIPMQPEGWMKLTKRMCAFFFGLAILNEVIWRGFSTETWVYFKTFGLTAAVFAFFITQAGLFQTYAVEDNED